MKKELRVSFYWDFVDVDESAEFIEVQFPNWFYDMRNRRIDPDVKEKLKTGKYKVLLVSEDESGK
jgi:hypothetical protein